MSATEFWKGSFGDAYNERNAGRVDANVHFFRRVFRSALARHKPMDIASAVELGCGVGDNLVALSRLRPGMSLWGVEVNKNAAEMVPVGSIICASLLDFTLQSPCELAFTKGVLIHIPPPDLEQAYRKLYEASSKYILIAEYHNPTPVEVEYRGHAGRLWKRDFAADFMSYWPVDLVDYGFAWKHDPDGSQDDLVWTLFRKVGTK